MNSLTVNTERFSASLEKCKECDGCGVEFEKPVGNIACVTFNNKGKAMCRYVFLCKGCFDDFLYVTKGKKFYRKETK